MTLPKMTKFKEFLLNNAYGLLILGIIILYMLSHPQRTLDVDCVCSFTIIDFEIIPIKMYESYIFIGFLFFVVLIAIFIIFNVYSKNKSNYIDF